MSVLLLVAFTAAASWDRFYVPWCEPSLDGVAAPQLLDPEGLYGVDPADGCTQVLGPVDLTDRFSQPGPADGPVEVRGATFEVNGVPLRFFGLNFMGEASRPAWGERKSEDHADADAHMHAVLERLAAGGVNLIRMHHIDDEDLLPGCDESSPADCDPDAPDPDLLDAMVSFVAAAGDAGIYVDLNLHTLRTFSSERFSHLDIEHNHNGAYSTKHLLYLLPELLEANKATTAHILGATMPEGHTLAEDPALGLIELTNENPLVFQWIKGRLNEERTPSENSNWASSATLAELDALWLDWLVDTHVDQGSLEGAWGAELEAGEELSEGTVVRLPFASFATATARYDDTLAFYEDLAAETYRDLRQHVRDLGFAGPILNTTSHYSQPDQVAAQQGVLPSSDPQFYDSHAGWDLRRTLEGEPTLYCYHERSMTEAYDSSVGSFLVEEPHTVLTEVSGATASHPLSALTTGAMSEAPYLVTEWATKSWAETQAESLPLMAIHSATQGWDGFLSLGYNTWTRWPSDTFEPLDEAVPWDLMRNPALAATAPFSALVARLGHGGASVTPLELHDSARAIGDRLLTDGITDSFDQPNLWSTLALTHPIRRGTLGGAAETTPADFASLSAGVKRSAPALQRAGGGLVWDFSAGQARMAVPQAAAVIGSVGASSVDAGWLQDVTVSNTDFAVVTAVTLDGEPVSSTEQILVTVVAEVRHETATADRMLSDGFACYEDPTPEGYFEVLFPVGSLSLQLGDVVARAVAVDAFQREAEATFTASDAGSWTLDFNDAPYTFGDGSLSQTFWFLVNVERSESPFQAEWP
jgi:hypothetical protein